MLHKKNITGYIGRANAEIAIKRGMGRKMYHTVSYSYLLSIHEMCSFIDGFKEGNAGKKIVLGPRNVRCLGVPTLTSLDH